MGLFSKKQKPWYESDEIKENMNLREIELENLDSELARVRFFPGSQSEYEAFVDYKVKIIDTKREDMGVEFLRDMGGIFVNAEKYTCSEGIGIKRYLADEGIEAVINCKRIPTIVDGKYRQIIYGLPVARAEI